MLSFLVDLDRFPIASLIALIVFHVSITFPLEAKISLSSSSTARKKWSKEVNIVVMERYLRSKVLDDNGVPMKRYRRRMYKEWKEHGLFDISEQRVWERAKAIKKYGWFTELRLEMKQRWIKGTVNHN